MNTELTIEFKPHTVGNGWMSDTATKSGKFSLSVIAGEYYYSTPREDLASPAEYTHFELAIFTDKGEWATYEQLKDCGAFDILGTTGEYSEGGSSCSVF